MQRTLSHDRVRRARARCGELLTGWPTPGCICCAAATGRSTRVGRSILSAASHAPVRCRQPLHGQPAACRTRARDPHGGPDSCPPGGSAHQAPAPGRQARAPQLPDATMIRCETAENRRDQTRLGAKAAQRRRRRRGLQHRRGFSHASSASHSILAAALPVVVDGRCPSPRSVWPATIRAGDRRSSIAVPDQGGRLGRRGSQTRSDQGRGSRTRCSR